MCAYLPVGCRTGLARAGGRPARRRPRGAAAGGAFPAQGPAGLGALRPGPDGLAHRPAGVARADRAAARTGGRSPGPAWCWCRRWPPTAAAVRLGPGRRLLRPHPGTGRPGNPAGGRAARRGARGRAAGRAARPPGDRCPASGAGLAARWGTIADPVELCWHSLRPSASRQPGGPVPTYQYACTACDHRFDAVQSFADASLTECPACSGVLRKVFSSVGIVFKGSGFYRTDSRAGARRERRRQGRGAKGDGPRATARPTGQDRERQERRHQERAPGSGRARRRRAVDEQRLGAPARPPRPPRAPPAAAASCRLDASCPHPPPVVHRSGSTTARLTPSPALASRHDRHRLTPRPRSQLGGARRRPGLAPGRCCCGARPPASLAAARARAGPRAPPGSQAYPGRRGRRRLAAGSTVARRRPRRPRAGPPSSSRRCRSRDPAAADGRVLVGAARAGEPITDARLAGAGRRSAPGRRGRCRSGWPMPASRGLLVPGSRVDVVTVGERNDEPVVLAAARTASSRSSARVAVVRTVGAGRDAAPGWRRGWRPPR